MRGPQPQQNRTNSDLKGKAPVQPSSLAGREERHSTQKQPYGIGQKQAGQALT